MRYSTKINAIEPFRVVELLTKAKARAAAGHDIVHMEAGEPDFVTAQPIIDAAHQALNDGATYYSQAQGLPDLKHAIADFYANEYQVAIDPRRIILTPGASGALQLLTALLVNPGDQVMMSDPGYPCNRNFVRLMGGIPQLVPVTAADQFQLNLENVQAHWSQNTQTLMLASPSNPTGTSVDRKEMQALVSFCAQQQGHLIVDEIYQSLCCDAQPFSTLELTDQAYVINSFSKYFGMTGWRLGWMVVPEHAVEALEHLAQNLFISMSTIAQFAALAAFKPETRHILEQRKRIFAQRRDYLVTALRELGLQIPCVPDGAFYIYINVEEYTDNSLQFCLDVLEEYGVAMTPGVDFGEYQAHTHIRLSYTTSMERLQEGVARLAKVFKK